jgi:magnesium-protoporphyrin IX monomethyl ester (oxidative) cyclase
MRRISARIDAAKAQGGMVGGIKRGWHIVTAGFAFANLYLTPVERHAIPADVRLVPAW